MEFSPHPAHSSLPWSELLQKMGPDAIRSRGPNGGMEDLKAGCLFLNCLLFCKNILKVNRNPLCPLILPQLSAGVCRSEVTISPCLNLGYSQLLSTSLHLEPET